MANRVRTSLSFRLPFSPYSLQKPAPISPPPLDPTINPFLHLRPVKHMGNPLLWASIETPPKPHKNFSHAPLSSPTGGTQAELFESLPTQLQSTTSISTFQPPNSTHSPVSTISKSSKLCLGLKTGRTRLRTAAKPYDNLDSHKRSCGTTSGIQILGNDQRRGEGDSCVDQTTNDEGHCSSGADGSMEGLGEVRSFLGYQLMI